MKNFPKVNASIAENAIFFGKPHKYSQVDELQKKPLTINLMGQCKSLDVNCVSQNRTHGITIFYILEPPALQKYSILEV